MPVVYLHVASLPGAVTPVFVTSGSQWGYHISGCFIYSVSCTPRQDILICQLCYRQFLLVGPLHLESRAQCGAPSLLCIV
jgi:hypothetical protein